MSDINISLSAGDKKRLLTGGKYCPDDIVVEAVGGASAAVEASDVNFYDYDGTLLYAYTLAEVQAMDELPPLPAHDGLICQGWNWSLDDLKVYAKPNDIMPFYITEDGATWYDLENDIGRDIAVTFRWHSYGETVLLDFGDGSEVYSDSTTAIGSTAEVTHVYAPGKYRAKLSGKFDLGKSNAVSDVDANSSMLLKKVFLGEYPYELLNYAFKGCKRLGSYTIPRTTGITEAQVFYECVNLYAVLIPRGGLSNQAISSSILQNCVSMQVLSITNTTKKWYGSGSMRSIKRICVPDELNMVGGSVADSEALVYINIPDVASNLYQNAFLRCKSLVALTIPESVVSIGAMALNSCSGLMTLKFLPTTPPTVGNANAFTGIPATCVVEVPTGTLAAYQAATNYAGIAAQMVEAES
jgi:hypothetical protein